MPRAPRLPHRIRLSLCALLAVAAHVPAHAAPAVEELDLKAAYIYNFIQFVEWPDGDAATGHDMTVCVSPFSPLKRALTALEGRQTSKGRTVHVKLLELPDLRPCRVVVLFNADVEPVALLLRSLPPGHGVLTVSDELTFVNPEVVIALSQQEGRVVFGISVDAAARAGLSISSRLLRLAKATR
jgi:hypothetical protein